MVGGLLAGYDRGLSCVVGLWSVWWWEGQWAGCVGRCVSLPLWRAGVAPDAFGYGGAMVGLLSICGHHGGSLCVPLAVAGDALPSSRIPRKSRTYAD